MDLIGLSFTEEFGSESCVCFELLMIGDSIIVFAGEDPNSKTPGMTCILSRFEVSVICVIILDGEETILKGELPAIIPES